MREARGAEWQEVMRQRQGCPIQRAAVASAVLQKGLVRALMVHVQCVWLEDASAAALALAHSCLSCVKSEQIMALGEIRSFLLNLILSPNMLH